MKNKKPKTLKERALKITFDFVPVFAGVIIALILNNIKEHRDDKKFLQNILDKIEANAEYNIYNLEDMLKKNRKLSDSLLFYADDKSIDISDILSKTGGMDIFPLDFSAWNVLKASPLVTDVEYEIVSKLYLLEEMNKLGNDMILNSLNMIERGSASPLKKEKFQGDVSDFNNGCEGMMDAFKAIKEYLEE